ncbi:uncharacterized protein BO88DRAFT_175897 [Aspergillus vadensis CBS 113365]|uniref:Uncharacterized protein n=1 Tax=Aspergillus vadensis (strain CBS 113365 / IMI 142717 / IBT 24658) TaxID=1448311 RepID=A0A319BMC6_ASPVC|nr:hypothetical protein BO88DRAFT_175897 [Aspergillus vadensis CBS 113365]PYH73039.1 hypothetical protein BO88DRAFT_175897 [Aspergillus vadensis CBS 113365]
MISVTGCLVADVEMYNERMLGHMEGEINPESITSFIGLAVLVHIVGLGWFDMSSIYASETLLPCGWKSYAVLVVFERPPDNPPSFPVINHILRDKSSLYITARAKVIQPASTIAVCQVCGECGLVGSAISCPNESLTYTWLRMSMYIQRQYCPSEKATFTIVV